MDNKYTILRVWIQTAHKLKILAALRSESMIALLDRLVAEEYDRARIPLADMERYLQHD